MADIVTMPKLGFDMAEGTLIRWVVNEGEKVSKGMVLAEIETDKATVEVESYYDGVILRHLVTEGEIVPISTPIALVGDEGEDVNVEELVGEVEPKVSKEKTPPVDEKAPRVADEEDQLPKDEETAQLPAGVRASPIARRMAEEHEIDLNDVKGSGPRGRIVKQDIKEYLDIRQEPERPEIPEVAIVTVTPAFLPRIETKEIPLSRLRAIIGRRMVDSTQQVPQFYITHEYDMSKVMDIRKQINEILPEEDKVSVNDFIVKAVAYTLHEFPNLNASLLEDKGVILRHGDINIGNAVSVENGLLTIVCRNADNKSIRQISKELKIMVQHAREGKVRPEDIEGSTFTLSNLGMFDVTHFTAIINPPEAAILAVGAVREIPISFSGEITSGLRMNVTLSVDHRVSDGAEGARFLQALSKYLEEPLKLLV